MATITKIKHFTVDLDFEEMQKDGTKVKPLYIELVAEVDADGEISEVGKTYRLIDLNFTDFMASTDIQNMVNSITESTTPAQFVQIFVGAMMKAIASEMDYAIAGENYVFPMTLRERLNLVQQALDEIILGGGA